MEENWNQVKLQKWLSEAFKKEGLSKKVHLN